MNATYNGEGQKDWAMKGTDKESTTEIERRGPGE
jgi:hypothetical protein